MVMHYTITKEKIGSRSIYIYDWIVLICIYSATPLFLSKKGAATRAFVIERMVTVSDRSPSRVAFCLAQVILCVLCVLHTDKEIDGVWRHTTVHTNRTRDPIIGVQLRSSLCFFFGSFLLVDDDGRGRRIECHPLSAAAALLKVFIFFPRWFFFPFNHGHPQFNSRMVVSG